MDDESLGQVKAREMSTAALKRPLKETVEPLSDADRVSVWISNRSRTFVLRNTHMRFVNGIGYDVDCVMADCIEGNREEEQSVAKVQKKSDEAFSAFGSTKPCSSL